MPKSMASPYVEGLDTLGYRHAEDCRHIEGGDRGLGRRGGCDGLDYN